MDFDFFFFVFDLSSFIFKENQEDNSSEKIVLVEEELDGV